MVSLAHQFPLHVPFLYNFLLYYHITDINSWNSVYQSRYYREVGVQIHEIGEITLCFAISYFVTPFLFDDLISFEPIIVFLAHTSVSGHNLGLAHSGGLVVVDANARPHSIVLLLNWTTML